MFTEVSNSIKEKHFYSKYGNEEYYFKLALYNNNGDCVFLQRNSVRHLTIEDNIFNPFHSGTLIISNDQTVIEKSPTPYVFLGNGRDIVDIEIIPLFNGDFESDSVNESNKEHVGLKFNFVITESTDLTFNGSVCKRLELVEYSQYMLSENICNIFALQKAGALGGNYMETNGGNGKPTGDVIESILYAVYNDNAKTDEIFYKDPITKQKVFEGESDTKLTLNPYGAMSYMEVLNYVLSFHSYKKSPCVLQFDRYQKKFMLISLKSLFENNKKYVIETLRFPSPSQTEFSSGEKKQENLAIKWETFPVTFEESKIMQYYVDSPTCKYNVDLAGNSGILSNSRSYKSMVFDLTTLNSETFMKTFYELFVKPFKDGFSDSENTNLSAFPNFYPNPNKKNNFDTNKGVLPPNLDEKKYLNQKMSSLLYLNNVYQYKLIGKTHRKSMSFVDVVKKAENKNGRFVATRWDLNNLGRHLVTSVKHIFEFDTYHNEIETIKPYRLVDGNETDSMKLEDFLKQGV
jgi:hypothetical protein